MPKLSLKLFFVSCSLILSFLPVDFIYAIDKADKSQVAINIGIYAPFSQKQSFIGRNMLGAMELARDQLNNPNIHYSFYTLDKLPEDKDPTSTLQQFIKVRKINVLVSEGSEKGVLLATLAKENNLIHFSLASDPAIADGKNNFLLWSPASEQASVLVNTLKQKKIKKLGVITTNHTSDRVLTQSVMQLLEADPSITIATYEQYAAGIKDFSDLISKIKGKKPELYFIMASPEDIEHIQSAMKTAHIDKPITSIVDRVTPKVMKVFNGHWYVDTHEMSPEFIHQYQEANFNYPATEAGYAFDAFHILNQSVIMAMKEKPNVTNDEVAEQIHHLAVGTGVMGPFNLDKHGVLFTQSEVKKIKDSEIRTA